MHSRRNCHRIRRPICTNPHSTHKKPWFDFTYLAATLIFSSFKNVHSLVLLLLLFTHWLRSTGILGWFSVRCSLDTRTSPSLWSAETWSWASTRPTRLNAAIENAGRLCTLVCPRSICAGHVSWSTTPEKK